MLTGMLVLSLSYNVFSLQTQSEADTTEIPKDWFLRDPEADKVQGLSVEKTYSTLLKQAIPHGYGSRDRFGD